jgi:uncharacterized membrane protein
MTKGRLEAFSDGVLAIIITIMVLELKVPHGTSLAALKPVFPILVSYIFSFIYIGIYWNNHHHLMHLVNKVNGNVLWANLHLLFWLSLVPFCTAWVDENFLEPLPVAMYSFILMMAGIAYYILVKTLVCIPGQNEKLAEAIGKDKKGIISVLIYIAAIPLCFVNTWIGIVLIAVVACIWLVPDRRVENLIEHKHS